MKQQGHAALDAVCADALKDSAGRIFVEAILGVCCVACAANAWRRIFQRIFQVFDKYTTLVRDAFGNSTFFTKAVHDACVFFVNNNCCTKVILCVVAVGWLMHVHFRCQRRRRFPPS